MLVLGLGGGTVQPREPGPEGPPVGQCSGVERRGGVETLLPGNRGGVHMGNVGGGGRDSSG